MAIRPRTSRRYFQGRRNKRRFHLTQAPPQEDKSVVHQLQDALWGGAAITSILWNYRTKDWVTNVYAADIDNDGDIEVILSSRDGTVRVHTPWGAKKWEKKWDGKDGQKAHYVSALCAISSADQKTPQRQACVIVGTRDGHVYALDQYGIQLPDWQYSIGRMVRQIYVRQNTPDYILVAAEDSCIHVIDRATGKPCWAPYKTNGWVRNVFLCDLDNDQRNEILAGSGDKHLYILDDRGQLLDKLFLGYQIYALFAAPLAIDGPMTIITSSNRKELFVWTVKRNPDGKWVQQKEWEITSASDLFKNRIHAISVEDINNDHEPEILLGSEDGYLYVLDRQGLLLWKRRFGSCIYSIWASDINFDGQKEIIVGTEDSGVYVLQIELDSNTYIRIKEVYEHAIQDGQVAAKNELMKVLTPREKAILKDFIDESPSLGHHARMEAEQALRLMNEGYYEQALSILLRVRQQKVQYCWSQPVITRGYIRTLGIGQIRAKGKYDLVVGTDDGYIYAIDAEHEGEPYIWTKDVQERVRMLQASFLHPDKLDSIVAVLANQHVLILNHQGELITEHAFENKEDKPRSLHIKPYSQEKSRESEIIIGQENKKISIWDAQIEHEQKSFATPQGSGILYAANLTQTDGIDIVSGSLNDHVYAYDRDGNELWNFQTQDRIQALYMEDIDYDGHVEIIVGSEDRHIYVLDYNGHLKWKYRTMRGVLDIAIDDTMLRQNVDKSSPRKPKILISSADGYLYALSEDGDLLWKYQGSGRIKAIRAKDFNQDGILEIAIASENHLDVLQLANASQIYEYIVQCWNKWLGEHIDDHTKIMELTYHPDEFIRAFALTRLARLHQRDEEDVKRFHEALRNDDSLEVKKELVRSIILLLNVPTNREENARQARNFIRQLSADPDTTIRLAIVDILSLLLELDEGLCFEYLEYFTHNVDLWVRHAVVRQLDELVANYPDRIFNLLLTTAHDEDEWIQQETGRTLSHYFDTHPERVIHDSIALLSRRTKTTILEQISYSARLPAVRHWFSCLVSFLDTLNKQTITEQLDTAIEALKELQAFTPIYGDDLNQVYLEFRRILQIHSKGAIARYQWTNTAAEEVDETYEIISTCMHMFDQFREIANIIRSLERRDAIRDRVTSLINAIDKIEAIRTELQQNEIHQQQTYPQGYYRLPEMAILALLLEQQYQIIKAELYRLRGNARLVAEIRNKEIQLEEEVVVSLLISNKGVSDADNIRVRITEVEKDFSVIGAKEHTLTQLPTSHSESVEFKLKPQSPAPRLKFQITYDDAEKHDKQEEFADVFFLRDRQRPYVEIPNHYTSGTPIRDRKMFYGRRNDIDTLCEKLSSATANKVVVLSGQRRMGKTSLIYQLTNELATGPQVPVLIDLQGQALQSMGQMFAGLALRVREEVLQRRHITLPPLDRESFLSNPTESFDSFLAEALSVLNNEKLVFMLDEFEVLQEKINNGSLNPDVLHYLRSLMQHRQGLNFLLVGAPGIHRDTEPRWSVFFNIALHHGLKKLEKDEAQALITDPLRGCLEYDMLALERMHRLSGNLPYFIHVISERLISYCNKQQKSYVTVNDINNVLEIVLEEQSSSIHWIWNQSASAMEHFLLSILAQDKGEDGRVFTFSDIYTELDAQGFPYDQEEITAALQNLVREDIIEELYDGTRYRLPVGLVKEWLRKMKPPERVLQDEAPYDK